MLGFAGGLHAGAIVISQGNTENISQLMQGPAGFTGYMAVGWTMGSTTYTNVTISALLIGDDPSGDTIDAYLDTQIGPGTTAGADEIASAFDISVPSGIFNTITLLTGVTLQAGDSYYLTLAPDASDEIEWGIDTSQPNPTVAAGVTEIPAEWCNNDIVGCGDYPPASPFGAYGDNPIFSVTSDPSPAPEPTTAFLMAGGLALLGFLRYRFLRYQQR